jgi:hypothetical protein
MPSSEAPSATLRRVAGPQFTTQISTNRRSRLRHRTSRTTAILPSVADTRNK